MPACCDNRRTLLLQKWRQEKVDERSPCAKQLIPTAQRTSTARRRTLPIQAEWTQLIVTGQCFTAVLNLIIIRGSVQTHLRAHHLYILHTSNILPSHLVLWQRSDEDPAVGRLSHVFPTRIAQDARTFTEAHVSHYGPNCRHAGATTTYVKKRRGDLQSERIAGLRIGWMDQSLFTTR